MAQISLAEYIHALEAKGLLRRYSDEKRVDELPQLMEANPDQAVFVERVKDSDFPFFANGYATRAMYALALDCDPIDVGREIARRTSLHCKAQLVETAPCKEVILKGDDVDLTILPLFNHLPASSGRRASPRLSSEVLDTTCSRSSSLVRLLQSPGSRPDPKITNLLGKRVIFL